MYFSNRYDQDVLLTLLLMQLYPKGRFVMFKSGSVLAINSTMNIEYEYFFEQPVVSYD